MQKNKNTINRSVLMTKKLVWMGNSLGIIIDKPVIEKLGLVKGDLVEIKIIKR